MTQNIERMNTTRVAMADPETIVKGLTYYEMWEFFKDQGSAFLGSQPAHNNGSA